MVRKITQWEREREGGRERGRNGSVTIDNITNDEAITFCLE